MTLNVTGVVIAASLVLQAAPAPQVRVRSGVEVVAVDVEVVGKDGTPVESLTAADFEIKFDGRARRVVSVDFVRSSPTTAEVAAGIATRSATPASAATAGLTPRMFVLAVDEHSLRVGSNRAAIEAAKRFIDRLGPTDMVGLHAYPTGTARTDLTTDHAAVKKALEHVMGLHQRPSVRFNLSASEIIDIASNDTFALQKVVARECNPTDRDCGRSIKDEATSLAGLYEMKNDQSMNALRGLIEGLARIPGRKTMVLISGGLLASDRSNGRVNVATEQKAVGREAAKANVNLYALHLDDEFLNAFSGQGKAPDFSNLFRESAIFARGLEMVARAAGGEVFRVEVGTPDRVMDRILRETSAHYLVGVESEDRDRDGKEHYISVKVKARGATVRHRTIVIIPVAR